MGFDSPVAEAIVAIGHLVVWVAIFNRMHATAIPRWTKKLGERIIYLLVAGIGLTVLASDLARWAPERVASASASIPTTFLGLPAVPSAIGIDLPAFVLSPPVLAFARLYRPLCFIAALAALVRRLWWIVALRRPAEFRIGERQRHDAVSGRTRSLGSLDQGPSEEAVRGEGTVSPSSSAEALSFPARPIAHWCGDALTRAVAALPLNQLLEIEVNRKELRSARLPAAFDGLSIVHVSDFHLTGRMTRAFYERIAELAAPLDPDVVVLAGDIVDRAHCLDWIGPIFASWRAREDRLFVLGNHDKRIADDREIRGRMSAAGWIDVAGKRLERQRGASRLVWSGNELPWYRGAERLERRPVRDDEYRILLSHAPDQVDFAIEHGFDLVLAGHTHGGQIRVPLIGPIVSPSHYGPKFASGEFRVGPTRMHVSRGVAGTHPIRLACSPEITKLTLRRG
ncbi:MAG TPA: hypothetical protein DCQ98_01685 [Planctomycetaceae bacterium]|nr:hypothetical protein [Planctomycetaceae bacterium]HRF01017.1 metallophosphoesterase [Pirellulaceae bacterium]